MAGDEALYLAKKTFRTGTVFNLDLDRPEGADGIDKQTVLYLFKELVRIAKAS